MSKSNDGSSSNAPTHGQQGGDGKLCTFTLDDKTVLFDGDDAGRWIQSDTTVDLADAA